jgi:hypothetical protein
VKEMVQLFLFLAKNNHNHDMIWLTSSTQSQAYDIKKELYERRSKGSKLLHKH